MNTSINFPNLGIHLSNVGKSISIGGFEIAYYGMIIACGMILGLCIAMWVAKKTNQNPDQYFDVALYAIPIALIGARAYYVIFSWDQYKDNLIHILYFREGGLAIFGGVIAAVITFYVYVKIKKQNFWLMADTACVGLVLGQIIGRWGNFFQQRGFRRLYKWSVCDATATECRTQFRCHAGDDGAPADDRRRTVYSGAPDFFIRKPLEYWRSAAAVAFYEA